MGRYYRSSSQPPIDDAALAALRPNMTTADVSHAFGAAWRAPAPHKGGLVDIAENTHGFTAHLDVDGKVGELVYAWQFRRAKVLGLEMGMTSDAARKVLPSLEISPPMGPAADLRKGAAHPSQDVAIIVEFQSENLHEIRLRNPHAVYAPPGPPPYPTVTAAVGAPFKDRNFKLVVLSNLIEAKVIDLGTPQDLAEHVLGRKVDLDTEGNEQIPAVRDYLDRFTLTPELLGRVESLDFDGGNEVYNYIQYRWDGEDGAFDTKDLGGIELMPNVERFDAVSMIDNVDLRLLVPLRKLRDVHVDGSFTHLEALLDVSSLKNCHLMSDRAYEDVTTPGTDTRRIMEALKARGVKIWVHWTTHEAPGPPAYK